MKTATKYKRIVNKISKLNAELRQLQDECEHQNAVGTYHSNTGNWCPQDDSYWLSCKCPECGKYWDIDSKETEYRKFDKRFNRKITLNT